MNKNFIRIGLGSLIVVVFLTGVMMLPEKTNSLMWSAYGCCIWALLVFSVAMGYWAAGNGIKYVLNAAYPLAVKSYLFIAILIAIVFGALSYAGAWTSPVGVFLLIEFAVFAVFAWRLLAMNAAKEAIMATEEAVKVNTVSWKVLTADVTAIADRAAAADKKAVTRIMETIRYADPMEHPAVAAVVEKINGKVAELGAAVDAGESEKISEICNALELLCKERANKLMIVK